LSLHLVSNGKMTLKEFTLIAKQVDSYVDYFHIREKQRSSQEIFDGVLWMLQAGIAPNKILINDRVDVALALGVGGVQLASHSLPTIVVKRQFPNLIVGRSIHSEEEALDAEQAGANFSIYGHIFSTDSKPGLKPRGCKLLNEICKSTTLPIIAIGGITPQNTIEVLRSGAKGIAIISGILDQDDPIQAAYQYKRSIKKWEEEQCGKTL
jgi:thiazole tautomerase (transcriptional regulator TenI)